MKAGQLPRANISRCGDGTAATLIVRQKRHAEQCECSERENEGHDNVARPLPDAVHSTMGR
jgi:hypothetical protein